MWGIGAFLLSGINACFCTVFEREGYGWRSAPVTSAAVHAFLRNRMRDQCQPWDMQVCRFSGETTGCLVRGYIGIDFRVLP